ncbi:MAG: hypothetical protein A2Z52_01745 [Candidatus Moranbacteria bacterium RBG_19FT_COMBO_42_6]|nr:MAG: hypothetical protein A2Z52_01745 [Candidatus Moranbacteria bacterium RBG_19FT_COMBO_42_6]
MINTKHLLKVVSAWISAVYVVCYLGVSFFPMSRQLFMRYSFHADVTLRSNYFGFEYFISGLIIWNIVALLSAGLFAYLFNAIKK